MGKRKVKPYTKQLKLLLADKSRILSKARAFAEMGLDETAESLWLSAASYEERIAPLLDGLGRDAEAALHRVSAASCYEKTGNPTRAANLYRAALAGPLADDAIEDVHEKLNGCLNQLQHASAEVVTSN